jgi:hypothetical protein
MIKILNALTAATSETDAAEKIQDYFVKKYPDIEDNADVTVNIYVNVTVEYECDIILMLNSKQTGYFKIANDMSIQQIVTNIEVKNIPVTLQGADIWLKRRNEDRRESATKQAQKQKFSLRKNLDPQPWVNEIIWARSNNRDDFDNDSLLLPPILFDDGDNFVERLLTLGSRRKSQDKNQPSCVYGVGYPSMQKVITNFEQKYFKEIKGTYLDRTRMEAITSRLVLKNQSYVAKMGEQMLIFKGDAGSGKTISLLNVALKLEKENKRVLLLTYNNALVSDIRRLLKLLKTGLINIQTGHLHFHAWSDEVNSRRPGRKKGPYEEDYQECIDEMNTLFDAWKDDLGKYKSRLQYNYDHVLIDEAQDWPDNEVQLLLKIYSSDKLILADGKKQLTKTDKYQEWHRHLPTEKAHQIVSLTKSLRLKTNITTFVTQLMSSLSPNENYWKLDPEDSIAGGNVTVILGDYYSKKVSRYFVQQSERRNPEPGGWAPIDDLYCCTTAANRKWVSEFENWDRKVWDGVNKETRKTYPRHNECFRMVEYDSCRGLEGWFSTCLSLDKFYDRKIKYAKTTNVQGDLYSTRTHEQQFADRWLLIPLTRAVDHLVIHLENPEHELAQHFRKVAERNTFVQVIDCKEAADALIDQEI